MIELQRQNLINRLSTLIDHCKDMKKLKQIQTQITTSPTLTKHDHYSLTTHLLFFTALSSSGSLHHATKIFNFIEEPNLFIYNIMIRANANKPCLGNCLMIYKQMLYNGVLPNCLTFPFMLKDCIKRFDFYVGFSVHGQIVKFGVCNDVFVRNCLISLYSSCGVLSKARFLFDEMLERDSASWNSMMTGYLKSGELDSALELFSRMEKRTIFTWNAIITGFVQGGRAKEALDFFHEMLSLSKGGVWPDKITIASVLSACAQLGAIEQGMWVHNYLMVQNLECDVVIGTALVDMYGKCGYVREAYDIFREMPKRDTLAWTAMISSLAVNGYAKEAFATFNEMEASGVKPNHVTFVGLLSACAHSGLVEKGRWCFDVMENVYSIQPHVHHYACMVDIFSRAGLFEEAERLIESMPVKPDVFVWGALIGGCQMHGNFELGEKVAQHLIKLEPTNHAFYMNLCDIYIKGSRFNDAMRIRDTMKERGVKKEVSGCSMIEIEGVVHEFSAREYSAIVSTKMMWVLHILSDDIKKNNIHNTIAQGGREKEV